MVWSVSNIQQPLFLNGTLPLSAGTTVGPILIQFPQSSAGYQINIQPFTGSPDVFVVDVKIQHQIASAPFGVLKTVATEFMTVSNFNSPGAISLIQGKLFGTALAITYTLAASAFINTITGGAFTADGIVATTYALPTFTPGFSKRTPVATVAGGLLLDSTTSGSMTGVLGNVAFVGVIPDFTGPVIMSANTPLGGGFAFIPRVDSFTVGGGTSPVNRIEGPSVASAAGINQAISLPGTWNVAYVKNNSTVAASAGFSLMVNTAGA